MNHQNETTDAHWLQHFANPEKAINDFKVESAGKYGPRISPAYLTRLLITHGNGTKQVSLNDEIADETIDRYWCPDGQDLPDDEQHWCTYSGILRPMLSNRRHRMLNENQWDMNEPLGIARLIYKANATCRVFKMDRRWCRENNVVHPHKFLAHWPNITMNGSRFLLMPRQNYYDVVYEFFNALHYQYNNNTIKYPELEMLAHAYFGSRSKRSVRPDW